MFLHNLKIYSRNDFIISYFIGKNYSFFDICVFDIDFLRFSSDHFSRIWKGERAKEDARGSFGGSEEIFEKLLTLDEKYDRIKKDISKGGVRA